MLNLAEYRHTSDRLADHLPWAALVAPGVVLNKDGSFQRTLRFRGPDLESATEAELVGACARLNNVLRRFGSGWALFFEAERFEAPGYPESVFPDAASWLVDEERRAGFEQAANDNHFAANDNVPWLHRRDHFESAYHLTLLYMPPPDQVASAERALLERAEPEKGRDWRQELAGFVAETERVRDLLAGFMPEIAALGDAETLTYLHGSIAGVGAVTIAGVTWMALNSTGLHRASGNDNELYGPAKAAPDALAGLPNGYGDMPKPKPQLGPPLPGDLGPPIVEREKQLGLPPAGSNAEDEAARAERLRQAQQAQQAREAGVFFQLQLTSATTGSTPAGATASAAPAPANANGADANHLSLDLDRDQNDQQRKLDFVNQAGEHGIYSDHALQTPASPYELLAGTVISAALSTGLNSDLPGTVIARVTEGVRDSISGRYLLIPQGSMLFGAYDSVVAFGQSRALVVWQRIVMPDGSSVQLDNLPATDPAGYAGLEDQVDYHTWTLLKGIAMSTLLGVGGQVTFGSNQSNLVEAIRESTAESTNQAGQRIVEKDINIQPTLTDRPGLPLRVLIHKDIIMRPYGGGGQ